MLSFKRMDIISVKTDEDIKACVACLKVAFAPVASQYNLNLKNAPGNGAFLDFGKLKSEMHKGLVLFCLKSDISDENKVIGTIGIKETRNDEWTLSRLSVRPEFQGEKIGAGLIRHIENLINENHMKKNHMKKKARPYTLKLGCIAEDQGLVAFYEKNGYTTENIKSFKTLPHKVCFMKKKVTP